MNILVCFKYIHDEDEITFKADRTVDVKDAPWVVSPYDLNTIEAAMKLAAAVGGGAALLSGIAGRRAAGDVSRRSPGEALRYAAE